MAKKEKSVKKAKESHCLECGGKGSFDGGDVICPTCKGKGKV